MSSVDIIDASKGKADVNSLVEELEFYGYKVNGTTATSTLTMDKTQIVVKKAGKTADKIASALAISAYTINEDKKNGTDVTIILGKDR